MLKGKMLNLLGALAAMAMSNSATAGINTVSAGNSGRKYFTGISPSGNKTYCESSRCKYRDWDLLAERRKAVAEYNAMIANPNIELTKRGLIKKPAITVPS